MAKCSIRGCKNEAVVHLKEIDLHFCQEHNDHFKKKLKIGRKTLSEEHREAEIERNRVQTRIKTIQVRRLERTKKEVLDRRLHIPIPRVESKIVDGRQVFVIKKKKEGGVNHRKVVH